MSQLTDEEFTAVTTTLGRLAGLVFDESRRDALGALVHERRTAAEAASIAAYLAFVETAAGQGELQRLLDAVTIQETHFFRNLPQIEALRRVIIPELLGHALAARRPLTVWSAGCSTGEEPYTVAMLVLEALRGRSALPVRIVGTDVSASAVEVARRAEYFGRTVQLAERGAAEQWFDPIANGGWRVKQEVRDLVEFQVHNLVSQPPPFGTGEVDLLVCRNVTIYFARETTRSLVGRFHAVMREGAYLVLGHAETLWQVSEAFSLVPAGEAFAYRRDSRPHPVWPGVERRSPPPPPPPPPPAAPMAPRRRGSRPPARSRATASKPEPLPDPIALAREALAGGQYEAAVTLAAEASAADPLSVAAHVLVGRAQANLGQQERALEALRKAIFLDPSAGHAHFLLASTLSSLGQVEAAASSFAAAAETLPLASGADLADLLDGRPVADLVDLCRGLAAVGRTTASTSSTSTAGRRRQ
jgi:chemotaxis protein methyltransferase CheR